MIRQFASLFALSLGLGLTGHAASFTASLDRDSIALGESATLALNFEGGQPDSAPVPDVPGLEIVAIGNSQNVNIVNGQMTATVTVTYSVTPRKTGTFVIPAMTVQIDGSPLSSSPLRLNVSPAESPPAAAINSGSEVAFMTLSLPSGSLYVGQTLAAQLQIWLRDDVRNFSNFHFTGQPANGFVIGKMVQGQSHTAQVGHRIYTVIPLTFALTVTNTGALSLGPFTAGATYWVPSGNGLGEDPFFGRMFNTGEPKRASLATETLQVTSRPLPKERVPADFNGAIGDFSLNATAGPTTVAVGDPVTLRVKISGRGALDAVTVPTPAANGFKVLPPTSKVETTDQLGLEGSKSFEEIFVPQTADVRELPALSFSYFNPADGRYHSLTQPSVPLTVHAGGGTALPVFAGNPSAAGENQAPADIMPIKERLGNLETGAVPLIGRRGFLAAQCLPVLVFLAAFVWRKRVDHLANNPRLRRQRAVAQRLRDGLADLRRLAEADQSAEFFTTLFRLLQDQLGERLDCPASAITENVVDEPALRRTAPRATLEALRELFQRCNQARYAPASGRAELAAVVAQFEKTVGELRNSKA